MVLQTWTLRPPTLRRPCLSLHRFPPLRPRRLLLSRPRGGMPQPLPLTITRCHLCLENHRLQRLRFDASKVSGPRQWQGLLFRPNAQPTPWCATGVSALQRPTRLALLIPHQMTFYHNVDMADMNATRGLPRLYGRVCALSKQTEQ